MLLVPLAAPAWATCDSEYYDGGPVHITDSGPTLPLGAAPWIVMSDTRADSGADRVRVVDKVMQPSGAPLTRDRMAARFSPETAKALGAIPDAAVELLAGIHCTTRRLPSGWGPLFVRIRYFDAAGNFSAWSPTWRLDRKSGQYEESP